MIGGLTYDDFATFWRQYENKKATQPQIDKAWADWCKQHSRK